MEKHIPIVETFTTVQGEGINVGVPSLFIRSGGCDLRCQFRGEACDTPYAVHTPADLTKHRPELSHGYTSWEPKTVSCLVNLILTQPVRHIVLTGGHPLLYQDSWAQVIQGVNAQSPDYTFEVETQGTIALNSFLQSARNVVYNVSVKLHSSNQEEGYDAKRINPQALQSFPINRSYYKFVITDPKRDLKEIEQILKINPLPVFVMPEGMSRTEVIQNSIEVVQFAIDHGFRFTPREHIVIWDTRKGV